MSMTWNATVTNQGIQLQTKQVQGSTLAFTRAVSGSGTVPVVNLKEQTAVSNIQQTLNIQTITMGVMQYVMNILLTNTNLHTGYNLSQIGLYATDPDVGEILFAIAQLDTPKEIPSFAESPGYNLEMSMTFANTQGANVTITPDLAGYVTVGTAQTMIENAIDPVNYPTFTEAESRTNIDSEESLSTLFGKIKKWFSDLKNVAFTGAYNDLTGRPTIGNGILTIKKNGTNLQTFAANQILSAEVDIECVDTVDSAMSDSSINPLQNKVVTAELKGAITATGNPLTVTDAAPVNAVNLSMDLEPIQDLHGYDHPWVGGAGKNKLPMTVEGIKANNQSGVWNGNVYTYNGITFTILTDSDGNVTGIKANGTSSAVTRLPLTTGYIQNIWKGNIVSGANGGSTNTYFINCNLSNNGSTWATEVDVSDGEKTISNYDYIEVAIFIRANVTLSNLICYPMIRLSTETDSSFAPYSNICPISGRSEVAIQRVGKNLFGGLDFANVLHAKSDYGTIDTTNKTVSFNRTSNYSPIFEYPFKENTQYTFIYSGNTESVNQRNTSILFEYTDGTESAAIDLSSNIKGTYAIQSTSGKTIKSIDLRWANGANAVLYYDECGLFEGVLTTSDFEPYAGKTYTIQIGDTIYGGELDVITGKMRGTHGEVDLGSLTYQRTNNFYYCALPNAKTPSSNSTPFNGISDRLEVVSANAINKAGVIALTTTGNIYTTTTDYDGGSLVSPTGQLVYELAEPFTIDLTPQQIEMLENTNTLSSDGTMTLEYQPNNAIGEAVRIAELDSDYKIAEVNARLEGEGNSSSNLLNIFNQTLFSGAMSVRANTQNGLVQNIHITGSMGGYNYIDFKIGTIDLKANVRYKMTGGIANSIILKVTRPAGSTAWIYGQPEDSGDGAVFWSNQDITANFILHIYSGTGSAGTDIYPMVCNINEEATEYVPHYPTNKELAASIIPVKKKVVSGITNDSGALAMIRASEIPSGHKIIPLFVAEIDLSGTGDTTRAFVRFDSVFNSYGGSVLGYFSEIDPGSGAEIKIANTDVTATFYYLELL